MHELSIAVAIIDGVLDEAERRGGLNVEAVRVKLGRLSGVDKEALLFAYQVARQDTPLATSRLEIEDIVPRIFCPACEQEREAGFGFICSHCGTPAGSLLQGGEMEISALEVTS